MKAKTLVLTATEAASAWSTNPADAGAQAIATRDHEIIREWARRHVAEPATGEETTSGPATIHLNDGGAGIRFNFPGAARFRPIAWEEWFAAFDLHRLMFVYEEEIADRAHAIWQARGAAPHGHDRQDWKEAERQLGGPAGRRMVRYRLMSAGTEG